MAGDTAEPGDATLGFPAVGATFAPAAEPVLSGITLGVRALVLGASGQPGVVPSMVSSVVHVSFLSFHLRSSRHSRRVGQASCTGKLRRECSVLAYCGCRTRSVWPGGRVVWLRAESVPEVAALRGLPYRFQMGRAVKCMKLDQVVVDLVASSKLVNHGCRRAVDRIITIVTAIPFRVQVLKNKN